MGTLSVGDSVKPPSRVLIAYDGLSAVLLGSVSGGVVHHADRPVLVVPQARRGD